MKYLTFYRAVVPYDRDQDGNVESVRLTRSYYPNLLAAKKYEPDCTALDESLRIVLDDPEYEPGICIDDLKNATLHGWIEDMRARRESSKRP